MFSEFCFEWTELSECPSEAEIMRGRKKGHFRGLKYYGFVSFSFSSSRLGFWNHLRASS